MVFASLVFLYFFLPLSLLLYFAWGNATWRNAVLAAFSLIFYAWGEPVWISLLLFSTTFDWIVGQLIERWRGTTKAQVALVASLCANLGLLAVFKYAGLIATTINDLTGWHLRPPGFSLPVGISFYTFQTISYVIDVYRGEVKAQKKYLNFLTFVTLFHQLVAGPIVRYSHIDQEIDQRTHSAREFSAGLHRLCIGLFKKVVIANVAGEWVKQTLDSDLSTLSVADGWLGLDHVHPADLLRLLGLLRHGHRPGVDDGLSLPRELQPPVHRPLGGGLLAALAHLAVHLLPRLRLHPAGRQGAAALPQPLHRLGADRAVARRQLELHPLGALQRPLHRAGAGGRPPGAGEAADRAAARST